MNAQHASPADETTKPTLSPRDGAVLALLVIAMTAASAAGLRVVTYGCFAVAGAWLVARLATQRRSGAADRARSTLEATPRGTPRSAPSTAPGRCSLRSTCSSSPAPA